MNCSTDVVDIVGTLEYGHVHMRRSMREKEKPGMRHREID
jgi:hypothetical protein